MTIGTLFVLHNYKFNEGRMLRLSVFDSCGLPHLMIDIHQFSSVIGARTIKITMYHHVMMSLMFRFTV
jgi:hypothetical protein